MKIYCNVSNKYRKLKKPELSYIKRKTLDLSIVYGSCDHEYKEIFKEEDSIKILLI